MRWVRCQMNSTRPRFSYVPIILHGLVAYALSSLVQIGRELSAVVVRLAEAMALIVPSIAGYFAMAPNPNWAASYLLICWLGAPFYFWFCWRLAGSVLPGWVAEQKASRFWTLSAINLIGAVTLVVVPTRHTRLTDASESVRIAALVLSLMKEYTWVFAAVTLVLVCCFSFVSAASIKAIQLRLSRSVSNHVEGGGL